MGHATWIFWSDGTFIADEKIPLSGVAQVSGGSLTLFTNEVGTLRRTIAMDRNTMIGDVLYLDGFRYARSSSLVITGPPPHGRQRRQADRSDRDVGRHVGRDGGRADEQNVMARQQHRHGDAEGRRRQHAQ